jgi:leucyl-tRNA synthetase
LWWNGKYIESRKSKKCQIKYNVVTQMLFNEYGADTLRLYEMFLGPLEQANLGIQQVFRVFLVSWKSCVVCISMNMQLLLMKYQQKTTWKPHKTIKKWQMTLRISLSILRFHNLWFVSTIDCSRLPFPCCSDPLTVVISPYTTYRRGIMVVIRWKLYCNGAFSCFRTKHLIESSKENSVSFNGKMRFTIRLPLDLTKDQIEEIIMKDERTKTIRRKNTK